MAVQYATKTPTDISVSKFVPGILIVPFRCQKAVFAPLRAVSLKKSTMGAFTVPCRVLSQKKMTGDGACFRIGSSLIGVKRILNHAHKAGTWYILGILFKIFVEHPILFIWEFPWDDGLETPTKHSSIKWPPFMKHTITRVSLTFSRGAN